jgi:hypothetical protein
MSALRSVLAVTIVAAVLAGCDAVTVPSPASGSPTSSEDPLAPTDVMADQMLGPWRRATIQLDDSRTAVLSDACAAAAREKLGEDDSTLPTALVDARGEGVATVILADDLRAVLCLATLDATGAATVDAVDRLSPTAVAPVEEADVTVASVLRLEDEAGRRTLAFGRAGPEAVKVKLSFPDSLVHTAALAEGWWAMWWPGNTGAISYAAVNAANFVLGAAKERPTGELDARVSPARWWLDPAARQPKPTATRIKALVLEQVCVGGKSPEGRVEPPTIVVDDSAITVTYEIRRLAGEGDCVSNAPFAVDLVLPEPLGDRPLLDGSETPPRDATKPAG